MAEDGRRKTATPAKDAPSVYADASRAPDFPSPATAAPSVTSLSSVFRLLSSVLSPGQRIIALAWPVFVAQIASIGMTVVDTLIVGRHSTTHLAAVAVGGSLYITLMLGMSGVLMALGPIIGQHYGAGRADDIGADIREGFWLAFILAVIGMALLAFPRLLLAPARLAPEIETIAVDYLRLLALSLPALLGFRVFQAAANALGFPAPLMYIGLLETLAHTAIAWALVGGHGGSPVLGASGAALSQLLVNWMSLFCALYLLARHRRFLPFAIFARFTLPRWTEQRALLRLGIPMGGSYLVEVSAFTLMALFIARLGAEAVSAYRVAANISAVTYILPLSLATATAALTAQAIGARDKALAWRTICAGQLVGVLAALVVATLLYSLRFHIARLSNPNAQVAMMAAGMMIYIASYQFFDAIQTIAAFALRAGKISFAPLCIHLCCFWGLGLGLGYWLAFYAPEPQGIAGFWQALVIATIAAALLLGSLLIIVTREWKTNAGRAPSSADP
ncbi:MAG: MATE family efflux transporter [Zoogloeaceae bacterium]|jgi:MATE family multidrug resistance protein|nr:MATE family efflux transporter [Zoogloeaceae bacterium]